MMAQHGQQLTSRRAANKLEAELADCQIKVPVKLTLAVGRSCLTTMPSGIRVIKRPVSGVTSNLTSEPAFGAVSGVDQVDHWRLRRFVRATTSQVGLIDSIGASDARSPAR